METYKNTILQVEIHQSSSTLNKVSEQRCHKTTTNKAVSQLSNLVSYKCRRCGFTALVVEEQKKWPTEEKWLLIVGVLNLIRPQHKAVVQRPRMVEILQSFV